MKVILFDGNCGLCNESVKFIIKYDVEKKFYYASLQSNFGQHFLKERSLNSKEFNTFILYEKGITYEIKSTAALYVLKELNFLGTIVFCSTIWIPKFIRDFIYDVIAKNRNKFFESNNCLLPEKELQQRFLT